VVYGGSQCKGYATRATGIAGPALGTGSERPSVYRLTMAPRQQAHRTHHYNVRCHWSGSTGAGYDAFSRTHDAEAHPAEVSLRLSADAAFGGDATLLNPEQLLVLAAASCQLLSFLAVAARARIDVRRYVDEGKGTMAEDDLPTRLTSIVLTPTIWVAPGPSGERVAHLVEVAHRECYVANSLRTDIRVEPTIIFEAPVEDVTN
jgi:organic hydroperoxide reductase OsmC/OhrA